MRFMATVAPGLEKIAQRQIIEIPQDILRGRIFFDTDMPLDNLLKLKCIDNLYMYIDQFEIGATKLSLANLKEKLRVDPYIIQSYMQSVIQEQLQKSSVHATVQSQICRIHVSVARSGKHSFSRFDMATVAMEALLKQPQFIPGDEYNHDLHFRLDAIDNTAYFSIKLTSAEFRYRGFKQFLPGAIRPSIANCMIWLSKPDKNDVFLDPFCGSGTIVSERSFYPNRKILGFDISDEAVDISRNIAPHAVIRQGDARNLPLKDKQVDAIVSNPPWDVQVQIQTDDLLNLYDSFLKEARRVLKDTGRIYLLTDKLEILKEIGEEPEVITQLSLHGLHPSIVRIKG